MSRAMAPATVETLEYIDAAIRFLCDARREARLGGAVKLVAKISSALKSAEGARRHAERRIRATAVSK